MAAPGKSLKAGATTRDRIIRAAYICFGRYSFAKTSIEDISTEAQLSRPTIYKAFENKEAIFDEICLLESRKLNDQLRDKVDRSQAFPDVLTDAIVLIVRLAMNNTYLRRGVESVSFSSHALTPGTVLNKEFHALWGGFIARAMQRGDLASDLSVDEVISWLSATEGMLMTRLDSLEMSDQELRRIVSRLIVPPLLSGSPGAATKRARRPIGKPRALAKPSS